MHYLLKGALTRKQFRHAIVTRQAEILIEIALAQVKIHQQYALAGSGQHRRRIHQDKRFAHARGRPGDHDQIVFGIQHGKLQRGAEAAQAFNGGIVRIDLFQHKHARRLRMDLFIQAESAFR